MQRKPIILILTSQNDDGVAENIAGLIRNIGSHNVVILTDEKYGKEPKSAVAGKIAVTGKFAIARATRITNAVKRFRPEIVVAITPYAYSSAIEAKKKSNFSAQIVYLMPYFALDKMYSDTGVFIVENAEIKSQLVANGVQSKKIMTMGLPFDIVKKTHPEVLALKQELGIPRNTTTVLLNATAKDGVEELFSLLLDQGNIINIVVYSPDLKTVSSLRQKADGVKATNTVILQNAEQLDDFLSACDVVITRFDRQTLYKSFKLSKPVITFGKGEQIEKELDFLVERGLVLRARENIEIVGLLYKLMQTNIASAYVTAADKWVEFVNIANIANYLVSFMM